MIEKVSDMNFELVATSRFGVMLCWGVNCTGKVLGQLRLEVRIRIRIISSR